MGPFLSKNMAKKSTTLKVLSEKDLFKKYSQSGKASIVIPSKEDTLWLPCDILALNYLLNGGIPYGRVIELLGYESTGKSLLALAFGRATQALGGALAWADAEMCWNNGWAIENGIDPDDVTLYEDNAVEPLADFIRDFIIFKRSILVNNEPIVIVIDSIAALECEENIESDQSEGKAEMGNRAKAIYKMYRKRNKFLAKYGAILIAINQVREKVGATMFENAETSPGGKATAYYASQRVALQRGKQIKHARKGKKERKVGQVVYMQTRKNKVGPPSDSVPTEVHFRPDKLGYVGYHKYAGLPDILVDEGIVEKKGSRYYFKGNSIANGEEQLVKILGTDKELRSKLLKRSSVNTIGKTRKKLEELSVNLYPVKLKTQDEE